VCNSLPREEAFNHEILLLTTHYELSIHYSIIT
jgi:hypothetical protein